MADSEAFVRESFQRSRIGTLDIGVVGKRRHHITALLEIDVTLAKRTLKGRQGLTFNSWLLKCIGDGVAQNPELHGIRRGEREIVRFLDVDMALVIEREVAGHRVPLPYVIRGINKKSPEEVCQDVRNGQRQPVDQTKGYVLGEVSQPVGARLYSYLPGFVRRLIWTFLLRNPLAVRRCMGTVMVTSIGMVGRFSGWVIPVSVHPLCFAVGAVVKKPWVVDGRVEPRDILHLTVLADHDVIDGAPAARAMARLIQMLERGHGLI